MATTQRFHALLWLIVTLCGLAIGSPPSAAADGPFERTLVVGLEIVNEERRIGYSILKSSGHLPAEVELLGRIARLERQGEQSRDAGREAERRASSELQELRTRLALSREGK